MWRRSIPFVPQMQASECGAACLAMVLAHHGRHVPLHEVRHACKAGRDGASAPAILQAARRFGLEARAVQVPLDGLGVLPTPAILHWQFRHFVVLERTREGGASIVDPAGGPRRVDALELGASFTGIALLLTPSRTFERLSERRPSLRGYRGALLAAAPALALIVGLSFVIEVLSVLTPAANQVLIDFIIRPRQERWLYALALALLGTSVASLLSTWARGRVLNTLQQLVDLKLIGALVGHLLRLPLQFFALRSPGDLMARVQGVSAVRDLACTCANALLDAVLLVGYGALMLGYDFRLGVVVLAVSLVRIALGSWMQSRTKHAVTGELTNGALEQAIVVEALSRIETTRACGAEGRTVDRYKSRLCARLNDTEKRRSISQIGSQWLSAGDAVSGAVVGFLGGSAVAREEMTIGTFCAFLMLQHLVGKPLSSLFAAFLQWSSIEAQLRRIDDVLQTPPVPNGRIDPGPLAGAVSFEAVRFRYQPGGAEILRGIDLAIAPGEKVAIVGRSGAGKSTLARLLLGFEAPSSGVVRIDGYDVTALDMARVRPQMGAVLQEPCLFDESVAWNIAAGRRVSRAELRAAARMAAIDDLITSLPAGYDSGVGARGDQLSGGERQRMAIARAVLGAPRIVVLDEATSALDPDNERRIHEKLRAMGATQIIIAHRLATVRDATRVVVMERGMVVQEGSFDALSVTPGPFRQLLECLV
jgi:ABC-type bacteriocin/lantibiotic exporter with double-glycine peptidase domain